jgi:hypothetical protein
MLVALIYLYDVSGTFSILEWYRVPLSLKVQVFLFVAFFLSFAVKVPMWPGAHLAAGRARRGADRRLGDPRGDHAQDRRVRASCASSCPSCRMLRGTCPGS